MFPGTDNDLTGPLGLPHAYHGETLYSWSARYHRLSCNVCASATSQQLFGHPNAGLRHDFPAYLDRFVERTRGFLGTAEEIIFTRTAFGLFALFLGDTLAIESIHRMQSDTNMRIKRTLGLLASRIGTPAPLKACSDCMRRDKDLAGTTWWHLEHQWPTVHVCREHGCRLMVAADGVHQATRRQWFLPHDLLHRDWSNNTQQSPAELGRLMRLATWTQTLLEARRAPFDPALLRHTYHMGAKSHGWVALDGSLRFKQLRTAFLETHAGLERLRGLEFLSTAQAEHGGFLGLLLRQFAGYRHPSKHLSLIAFLFETTEDFLREYQDACTAAEANGPGNLNDRLTTSRERLLTMVREGRSINAAAHSLGLPVTQAIRHLTQQGVAYRRRPRILDQTKEKQLVDELRTGRDRDEIAAELGIRQAFIKDYLAQHPDLRAVWMENNMTRRKELYRARFLEVLTMNPGLPIRQIRRLPHNGFQWLYRNDRAWLIKNLPAIWCRPV